MNLSGDSLVARANNLGVPTGQTIPFTVMHKHKFPLFYESVGNTMLTFYFMQFPNKCLYIPQNFQDA